MERDSKMNKVKIYLFGIGAAFILFHSAFATETEEDKIRQFCAQCDLENPHSNMVMDDILSNYRKNKTLDLSSKQLTKLPSEIGNITGMVGLNLYSNQLENLPSQISKLTNLLELDISCNKLKVLPQVIYELTSLTELHASANDLQTFPEGIGKLTQLQCLKLDKNKLKSVPMDFYHLTELTCLYLHENLLDFLDPKIGNFMTINVLTLGNNPLCSLPLELGTLEKLTYLQLPTEDFCAWGKKWQKMQKGTLKDFRFHCRSMMTSYQKYRVFVHLSHNVNSDFFIAKEIVYHIFQYLSLRV
jgi:hypothetical protein